MNAHAEIGYDARREDKPTRARQPEHADGPVYVTPNVVTHAKCQAWRAGCGNTVAVTTEGLASLEAFSAILTERGEDALELNDCFPCDDCVGKRQAAALDKSAARRQRTTEAIRYLKAADSGVLEEAHELHKADAKGVRARDAVIASLERLAYLRKVLGEGHVLDLINAIRDSRRSGGKAKGRGGEL